MKHAFFWAGRIQTLYECVLEHAVFTLLGFVFVHSLALYVDSLRQKFQDAFAAVRRPLFACRL